MASQFINSNLNSNRIRINTYHACSLNPLLLAQYCSLLAPAVSDETRFLQYLLQILCCRRGLIAGPLTLSGKQEYFLAVSKTSCHYFTLLVKPFPRRFLPCHRFLSRINPGAVYLWHDYYIILYPTIQLLLYKEYTMLRNVRHV